MNNIIAESNLNDKKEKLNVFKENISRYLTWEDVFLKTFSSDSAILSFEYEINEVKCQFKIHVSPRDKIPKGKQISNST